MKIKANVFLLIIATILFTTTITVSAGFLESLDEELTGIVSKAEPFLVTVEAEDHHLGRMFVGSGVLIDKDGYIITTASVVGDDNDIVVRFKNENSYPAEIIGVDRQSGLALLKIEPIDHQTPTFGDPRKLKEGSWITVIGNSYDIPSSVNFGVFSGITDNGLLQLSVQSDPGSSGGAVFNTKGEVIGILAAQTTETLSLFCPEDKLLGIKADIYNSYSMGRLKIFGIDIPSSNTSLAVPVDKLDKIIDQLKKYGEVKYGFLGIKQTGLNKRTRQDNNIEGGVLVTNVSKDSPAEKAGLLEDDIIVKFKGTPIKGPGHLYDLVRSHNPGDEIRLEILRDGSTKKVTVTLGEAANDEHFGYFNYPGFYSTDDDVKAAIQKKLKDGLIDL